MLSGILAGAASCTDLDTDIKSQYTTYPDNPIATSAELEGCYYYLRSEANLGRNYWEAVECQADEIMGICFTATGYYDKGRAIFPTIHKISDDLTSGGQLAEMMSGCTYCNKVIIELGGAEGKDAIVAPVRAARAFYTFMMMDMYGDVPILDHTPEDDEAIERQPRADVAKFIESELLEIIPQLTEENNSDTYGRPNKWMAEALLAKLYLNWGVYTAGDVKTVTNSTPNEKLNDCVAVCDEIIKSGIFEVGKGYRKKFFPDNGLDDNGNIIVKDFIYAMPFDPASLGSSYSGGHELDRFCTFKKANGTTDSKGNTMGPWGYVPAKSTAGSFVLTPECVARFNLEGDERNEIILKGPQYITDPVTYEFTDEPLMYKGEQVNYSVDITDWDDISILSVGADSEAKNIMKGAHLGKYPSDEATFNTYSRKQKNDLPIFRYADILLTKAECILRGATATNGDTPASLINQVRDCSSAPHVTGTPTLQELLDERGREFICEMWRRNDLIRFGQFENDWGYKHDANPSAKTELWRRVMPIPRGSMETNTNWTQNEGYANN